MDESKNNQFQMEIKPDIAAGLYTNLAVITHSHSDFILDFVRMFPGMPKAEVASRVIMSPENAKRLLQALSDNIAKYENEFGTISFAEQGPKTIAPFGNNGGRA